MKSVNSKGWSGSHFFDGLGYLGVCGGYMCNSQYSQPKGEVVIYFSLKNKNFLKCYIGL